MSTELKREYLRNIRQRYHRGTKKQRTLFHESDVHMHKLLTEISASTIDRHLEKFRETAPNGLSSTNPSLLKNKIPIELLDYQIKEPGFIEADTVAHCGTSLAGDFVNTLTMTEVFTGWTENRAMLGKEGRTALGAIRSIEKSLPF